MTKEERVIEFIKNNPNKYKIIDVAKELGINPDIVYSTIDDHPEIRPLLGSNTKFTHVIDFIKDNPNKYSVSTAAKKLNIKYDVVSDIVRCNPEIKGLLLQCNDIYSIVKLIEDNPNMYTISGVAKEFGLSEYRVKSFLKNNPNLKFLTANEMKAACLISFIRNNNPNKYTIVELAKECDISPAYAAKIIKNNPEISKLELAFSKDTSKRSRLKEFINENPGKYSLSDLAKEFDITRVYLSSVIKKNPELKELIVVRDRYSAVIDFIRRNPNKCSALHISEKFGISKQTILKIVKSNSDISDSLITDVEFRRNAVVDFIRRNPNK